MNSNHTPEAIYTTTLELANYYDEIKNVTKTLEYSFKLVQEDSTDVIGLTKIVYWSSFFKKYDNILKLMELIRGNNLKINKLKEVFIRENRIHLRNQLLNMYINIIKEKEQHNITNNKKLSDYLDLFNSMSFDMDIYTIYDAIQEEIKILNDTQ
jgi:hypothetical protein